MVTALTIRTVLQKKSNIPIIYTVLTIRTVLQKNQAVLLQSLCKLSERYFRQIKQTYYRHCVNYQIGLIDKSNRSIIVTVLTIRTVQWTNQTHLLQALSYLLDRFNRQINRPMRVTVITIRTVLQTSQTDLSQSLC